MRFLLDVNVGITIAAALEAAGHDTVRAALISPRDEDPDILAMAVAERCILVTYDRDFGELVFVRDLPLPPGVIYIRAEPEDVEQTALRLLSLLDSELLSGHMTVIDDRRVRHTPFPIESNDNG